MKTKNLANSIFLPFFILGFLFLLAFSLGSFLLTYQGLSYTIEDQLKSSQTVFSDHILNDLLSGAESEVFRKCNAFSENPLVNSVSVALVDGLKVCNVIKSNEKNSFEISSTIFYDESNNTPFAKVTVKYSKSNLSTIGLNLKLFFTIMLVLFGLVQLFFLLRLSKRVSRPISDFSKLLAEGTPNQLVLYDGSAANSELQEVRNLYIGAKKLAENIISAQDKLVDETNKSSRVIIATQVAHDIRSPLSALEMISSQLSELSEDKRLIIRNSINRIRDIANSLTSKNISLSASSSSSNLSSSSQKETFETTLILPVLDVLITEKRLEYRDKLGIEIEFNQSVDSYGLFAKISASSFKRVLSNLINNAVEALPNNIGKVQVSLKQLNHSMTFTIHDNGKGIPDDVLPKLGVRGATFSKTLGSGLGLAHAKETIEEWGGTITIDSKVGIGTSVRISLPKEREPTWFLPKLDLIKIDTVVIFDDDQSIHQIWKGRIESATTSNLKIRLVHISTTEQFRNYFKQSIAEINNSIFLMDYEILGQSETGLDLIEQLDIGSKSILVTSRYEEPIIRQRCERLKLKLIPKNMSGFIPIKVD